MKKLLFLVLLLSYSGFSFGQNLTGAWTGTLKIQGTELPLVFNFIKTATGYTATMDSPKQGAKGIPIDAVNFANKQLTVYVKAAGLKYDGEWKSDKIITGTFSQGAFSAPLNLTKGVVELPKPQEPQKPFSYYTEEVQFVNQKENIALAGTLSLPQKEGKFPAVILISGSGQQNRDSEILGHKPFLVIADYLTKKGIAVLRYDDRGVGESKGDPTLSTSADFANDAAAAIAYLRTRKEIDLKKIGVIGHSEGGIIAPMLAANDKNIAFIVLLAGTGVAGDVLLVDQNYQVGKQAGMSKEQLAEAKITNQAIYTIVKEDTDLVQMKKNITAFLQTTIDKPSEKKQISQQAIDTSLKKQVDAITIPWLRYFISYNPAQNLKKVQCPVLVLNGENDIQVSAKLNTEAIAKALKEGRNKKFKVEIFPGLNHLFQHCTTCTVEEYSQLEETFSPEVLKTMADWIQQIVK
jgi:pimeloyl-ACP methyl ester carboxylesterase